MSRVQNSNFSEIYGGQLPGSNLTLYSTAGAGSGDFISFRTGSQTERLKITGAGVITLTGTVNITGALSPTGVINGPDGTKTNPTFSFTSDPDTGIYRIGANNLGVSCGDTKIIDVATTGVAVTGTLSASSTLTASNGFTVSAGSVSFPAASISTAALSGSLVTFGTPVATTSGSIVAITTSIPSTARIIHVSLNGVSTNGTSNMLIQIGDSGGIETSGYNSGAFTDGSGPGVQSTAGFIINTVVTAATTMSGTVILTMVNSSNNTWCSNGNINRSDGAAWASSGVKSTSATMDRISITTANGTDTFDAGEVNIVYF